MNLRRLLAYAAIYVLWGGTYLAVRTVVLVTPPFSAAALRFLLSGITLLLISRIQRQPWPTRREWVNSAKLGLAMFTINYACFFWAEQRIYSGVASIVVSTLPVWVFLTEWLLLKTQKLSFSIVFASALGITGVALLMHSGATNATNHAETRVAILVLLAGTIAWAIGSVWSRKLALPPQQSVRSALQMTTGGVFLGLLAVGEGEGRHLIGALQTWTWGIWFCFAYLVATSILAFTAYVWLLHHEPAGRVASYAYVNPLVAIALGVGFGHEHIGRWQLLGAALVLLAVFATLAMRQQSTAEKA